LFEVFWCLAVIPVKLSIAFMLVRIAGVKRLYTHSLYAVSALVAVMNLIALFYIIFRCTPVSYAQIPSISQYLRYLRSHLLTCQQLRLGYEHRGRSLPVGL